MGQAATQADGEHEDRQLHQAFVDSDRPENKVSISDWLEITTAWRPHAAIAKVSPPKGNYQPIRRLITALPAL